MNWSKGKSRLIILFLSINIILGWANYNKLAGSYLLKDTQVQDIKQVMLENNIEIKSPLPKQYEPLQQLTVFPYQMDSSSRDTVVKNFFGTLEDVSISVEAPKSPDGKPRRIYKKEDELVVFEGENILYHHQGAKEEGNFQALDLNGVKRISERWLKKIGYSPKQMYFQVIEEAEDWQLIYYDQYQKMPVFNSYVKFTISPWGVTDIVIQKIELGETTGKEEDIFPADQMLFYLMNEIAKEEKAVITDVMIGYALENPKGTQLIAEKATPFYRVILEGGIIYYVNAYNNDIMEESLE